jgi:hypothetical protein
LRAECDGVLNINRLNKSEINQEFEWLMVCFAYIWLLVASPEGTRAAFLFLLEKYVEMSDNQIRSSVFETLILWEKSMLLTS